MQALDNERAFDDWDDMAEDLHEHVQAKGFHFAYWSKIIVDAQSGKRNESRIGLLCNKTGVIWHMQQDEWNEQNPVGKNFWKDAERKKAYMQALKFRFSMSRDNISTCKVGGCTHGANPKKEGFCGWCYNRFEKGMLDVDGNRTLTWKERKERIRGKIKIEHLTVMQTEEPECLDTFVCEKLHITIEEVCCFRRIFVDKHARKTCTDCHIHDQRFDFLEEFIDSREE